MPTHLITGPFPELWRGIEHEHLVLVDGHGLDGKPFLEGPRVEIAPVADILMEDIEQDGPTIDALCEVLLVDLAESLNRIHGVEESLRYWRMVLAPWIRETVLLLYVRAKTLAGVLTGFPDAVLPRLGSPLDIPTPKDHYEAAELYHTPKLRHVVYQQVYDAVRSGWSMARTRHVSSSTSSLSERGATLAPLGPATRVTHLMVLGANWRPIDRVLLYLGSRLLPQSRVLRRPIFSQDVQQDVRSVITVDRLSLSLGQIASLIPRLLPICFLEGWNHLHGSAAPFASRRSMLVTNAGLRRSAEIRVIAAELQRRGSPVVVVQEGGGFGDKLIKNLESLDLVLADHFIKWGSLSAEAGTSLGVMNSRGIPRRGSNNGDVLVILGPTYAAPKDLGSVGRIPTSGYLDIIDDFTAHLSPRTRSHVVVRAKSTLEGGSRKDRVSQTRVVNGDAVIRVSDNAEPVGRPVGRARLSIVTYNQSLAPLLLSVGRPTLLLWNDHYSPVPAVVEPLMERLRLAKVWFGSGDECAAHVEEIFDDVERWWHQTIVQEAVRAYQDAFGRRVTLPGYRCGRAMRSVLRARMHQPA
jgi:putative transferase (TIGR04331 family)